MLHTLNKAWIDILAHQIQNERINNFLCVYTTDEELALILKAQREYHISIDKIQADYISYQLYFDRLYSINSETRPIKILTKKMYDDILISHDLHDIFVKSYLNKHCRRKGG